MCLAGQVRIGAEVRTPPVEPTPFTESMFSAEIPKGTYRLVIAVWLQSIGGHALAFADCGDRLQVS